MGTTGQRAHTDSGLRARELYPARTGARIRGDRAAALAWIAFTAWLGWGAAEAQAQPRPPNPASDGSAAEPPSNAAARETYVRGEEHNRADR